MTNEKQNIPYDPIDIHAEESLLGAIKTANALDMSVPIGSETESIAEKVRERMGVEPGESAELAVSIDQVKDDEKKPAGEMLFVKATITHHNGNQEIKALPVGHAFEGMVSPRKNFTEDEVFTLHSMAKGLQETRTQGLLTRLDSKGHDIVNPAQNMGRRRLPPIAK